MAIGFGLSAVYRVTTRVMATATLILTGMTLALVIVTVVLVIATRAGVERTRKEVKVALERLGRLPRAGLEQEPLPDQEPREGGGMVTRVEPEPAEQAPQPAEAPEAGPSPPTDSSRRQVTDIWGQPIGQRKRRGR